MIIEDAVALGQQALWTSLLCGGPLLLTALVVGTLVSLLQAVTQIQEMTLVFVPKLLAVFAVAGLSGSWILSVLVDFAESIYAEIGPLGI